MESLGFAKTLRLRTLSPIRKILKKLQVTRGARKPKHKVHGKHLKIAFFTDTYLPNVDGVVSSILSFRKELERRGHEVSVFASGSKSDEEENEDPRVFFFNSIRFPPYPQYKIALFPFGSRQIVKEEEVQLVHSHAIASMGLAAMTTAKTLGLPLVGTFHTMAPKTGFLFVKDEIGRSIFSALTWKAIQQFYRPYDLVLAPTETVKALLQENGVENTKVVPNGIDIKRFSPNPHSKLVREMLGIKADEKVVLTAGRVSDEKNVDVFVKAAKLVLEKEKARFIVQGDGPARTKCVKLAHKLGMDGKIIFTGFVKEFEVPFFYNACDVFATASTFETQGLSLLEVMACGKVPVAADALAIPELVHHGKNGFLFTPNNERDMAEKIVEALRLSEKEKKRMEENARKTAVQFSIGKSAGKLLKAYREVL